MCMNMHTHRYSKSRNSCGVERVIQSMKGSIAMHRDVWSQTMLISVMYVYMMLVAREAMYSGC